MTPQVTEPLMGNNSEGNDPTVKACGSTQLIKTPQDLVSTCCMNHTILKVKCLFLKYLSPPPHTHWSTSLPSTLSPSNGPSDSVPVRLTRLLPSPHPPGCSATNGGAAAIQRRVSWVRHQWYANEKFHVWDPMKTHLRPLPIEGLI